MTTETTPEQMLDTLTWLKCGECGGTKYVPFKHNDVVSVPSFVPCDKCQDKGTATGLQFPALSGECDQCGVQLGPSGKRHVFRGNSEHCLTCQGRNRIHRRSDVLEAVLENFIGQVGSGVDIMPLVKGGYGVSLSIGGAFWVTGKSLREAAIAALYASAVAQGLIDASH